MKKLMLIATIVAISSTNALAGNVAYNQAKKAGIIKCLPAIHKVTNFIIKNGNAGAHSFWGSKKPDSSAFSTAIERDFSDGIIFSNIVVAPTLDGSCYVEYEKIINENKPCIAVAQSLKNAKYQNSLNKNISILNQDGVVIYLIPNGNQCTMVRKEVIFGDVLPISH